MSSLDLLPHACRWIILSALLVQACHGTSIVWVVSETGEYVVLAADSREVDAMGRLKPSDRACKVIALDDTVFFNSGSVLSRTYRVGSWRSLKAAREIYIASKERQAEPLSIAWGNEAMTFFYRLSVTELRSSANANGSIVTGGFINFDPTMNPAAFSQTLYFNAEPLQLSRKPDSQAKGQIGISGIHPELVVEFIKAETPRAVKGYGTLTIHKAAPDLSYDIEFVKKAVQFVIDNVSGEDKQHVHGPIDVVVVRRLGGVDWITRKQSCYAEDFHSPKKTSAKKLPTQTAK
jgi:hypothetical protein